ncbi:FAD-binding monooxygenase [Actinomadura alba]|uniref:FAD-binding monooxygenase n=1 Tax=Actinomadura alba TaxID=406431 RepID=A0ABR7LS42_9ACTN|nr:FAD-binding monooxygenase [Actinomadura alba]
MVLGGSLSGLFAARVLADAYDEVLIIDRDVLIDVDVPRRGCPQGRHINGLLTGGQRAIEELFPGITDEMLADGVPKGDLGGTVRWYMQGKQLEKQHADMLCIGPSRPKLEFHVRQRTQALSNVTFVERTDILGLETSADRSRVSGVRVQHLDGGDAKVLEGDVVVDATGRGSRTPVWLAELGYPQVVEERKKIGLGYVTQYYRLNSDPYHGDLSINVVAYPGRPRGCIFAKTDGGRIEMTTYGILGDHPPTDQAGLYAWIDSLGIPEYSDALRDATPLTEPVAFRFPTTLRRRYEDMPRFPGGLLITGDAVSCFNPVYAGGMTMAAKAALTLRSHLHTGADPQPLEYFRDLARDVLDPHWEMTNVVDLSFPDVEGERTRTVRMAQAFLKRVQIAATRDGKVTAAYMRAAGQVERPESLQRPGMLLRILVQSLRGPKSRPPNKVTRPAQPAAEQSTEQAV